MGFDIGSGADPADVRSDARHYGLSWKEARHMPFATLLAWLDERRPVMLMLQAWSLRKDPKYLGWKDGHWVVAIGYDDRAVYFEDPVLKGRRGYLSYVELDGRWHDVEGRTRIRQVFRYGIALWGNEDQTRPRPHLASVGPIG